MDKIYILDSTILLGNPEYLLSLKDGEIIISKQALEDVSSKTRYMDEIGTNARRVFRLIYEEIENAIKSGIGLNLSFANCEHLNMKFPMDSFLNRTENKLLILGKEIELREKKQGSNKNVIIITNDVMQCIKGDAIGLICSRC